MNIDTKYNIGDKVYALKSYHTTYLDKEILEYTVYKEKCTITDIIIRVNNDGITISYLLDSDIYLIVGEYKDDSLFTDLDKALEECEIRNIKSRCKCKNGNKHRE